MASAEEALAGARDIIAEWISEDETARARMREYFVSQAVFRSKIITGQEEAGIKYRDYFDWEEPVTTAPSHRILALRRGEKEGFLTLRVIPPEEEALDILEQLFVKGEGPASRQVQQAVQDGYKRLLSPSMETEIRLETKRRADQEAIRVFAENLRQLLLAPPLGRKKGPGHRSRVSAPGARWSASTGRGNCSITTPFILLSEKGAEQAGGRDPRSCAIVSAIEAIAIGNGTAGRETEAFVRGLDLAREHPGDHGQRERRFDLLRLRGGPGGVSRPGRDRARGAFPSAGG